MRKGVLYFKSNISLIMISPQTFTIRALSDNFEILLYQITIQYKNLIKKKIFGLYNSNFSAAKTYLVLKW